MWVSKQCPPWFLLYLLDCERVPWSVSRPAFKILPWVSALTSLNDGLWPDCTNWNNHFPSLSCFWSECFITANGKELEHSSFYSPGCSLRSMVLLCFLSFFIMSKTYLHCSTCQHIVPFCGWIIFHPETRSHLVYSSIDIQAVSTFWLLWWAQKCCM